MKTAFTFALQSKIMLWLMVLLVGIISLSVSSTSVSALDQRVNYTSLTTDVQTNPQGINISAMNTAPYGFRITNVTRVSGVTANTCLIINQTNDIVNSSTNIIGDVCYIGWNINDTRSWTIAFVNGSGGVHNSIRNVPANTPQNTTYINITTGWGDNSTYSNTRNVVSLGILLNQNPALPTVTLSYPPDNAQLVQIGANFTANYTAGTYNFTNATFFVWNSTGAIFNSTNVSVLGNTTNSTRLFIDNFVFGETYTWNVNLCTVNNTATYCTWADSNFTFRSVPFTVSNVYYNTSVFETSYQEFNISIASSSAISAAAVLTYNGTTYSSTTRCTTSTCDFINNIDIPLVTGSQQNVTFWWNISVFSGTTITQYASQVYNNSNNQISMSYCSTGTRAMNFTVYDEQNKTRFANFSFDGEFQYYLGQGSVYRNFSISNQTTNEVDICIGQNQNFKINTIISYDEALSSTAGYSPRNWFYQNYRVNQTRQDIFMYLLRSSVATQFVLQVQDRFLLPVSNVVIAAQRCYPGYLTNETVFRHRTDNTGFTTGDFEADTALYKFFISNQSIDLLAVDQCSAVVPQTAPYTLTFQIGEGYVSPFDINNVSNMNETLVFNYSSNILTLTYIDTSGNFSYANLIVRSMNFSGSSQPIVCNQNNTFSSGIITCNVSTAGSYTATAYVYRSNQILIDQLIFTVSTIASTVGYYGVFLAFFIILISSFVFKYNEIAGIWSVTITTIVLNYIGLIAFGKVFITAMLGVAIILTAVLER